MKAKVEEELDSLVSEGVLDPVQFADWAAPIVPLLKSDKKSIRICGDFKRTVNQAAKLDTYPIPRIEDLFATLAGGKMFTKLDLSQAYQQVKLEEVSKAYVVINTHRDLLPLFFQVPQLLIIAGAVWPRYLCHNQALTQCISFEVTLLSQ